MKTLQQAIEQMPADEILYINAPAIQFLMTGTHRATVNKAGLVQIEYADGTEEKRQANEALLKTVDGENTSLFSLVSFVQAGR